MKINFYYFYVIFCLAVFFVASSFALSADNNYSPIKSATQSVVVSSGAGQFNGVNLEKIFYLSTTSEKKAIIDIQINADKIDILAPQAYAVGSDLILHGGLSQELQGAIEKYKVKKVMPLVVNSKFNQTIIHNLLISKKDQDAVIKGLVYLAKKNNYIGWQFDFENISYLDRDLYSVFIEKTAQVLHENGLILSVAAVTRIVDYEDTNAFKNWGGAFDYARIAMVVDFISLMTYDDSNSVGPVASIPFINRALNYVKDKIPQEKLSLGIPLYYWGWSQTPYKRISSGPYSLAAFTLQNFRCKQAFDNILGVPWFTYSVAGTSYKIWYENEQSFENKLNIVKDNNLRGFSAWVLGSEDPGIWSFLNKSMD